MTSEPCFSCLEIEIKNEKEKNQEQCTAEIVNYTLSLPQILLLGIDIILKDISIGSIWFVESFLTMSTAIEHKAKYEKVLIIL